MYPSKYEFRSWPATETWSANLLAWTVLKCGRPLGQKCFCICLLIHLCLLNKIRGTVLSTQKKSKHLFSPTPEKQTERERKINFRRVAIKSLYLKSIYFHLWNFLLSLYGPFLIKWQKMKKSLLRSVRFIRKISGKYVSSVLFEDIFVCGGE